MSNVMSNGSEPWQGAFDEGRADAKAAIEVPSTHPPSERDLWPNPDSAVNEYMRHWRRGWNYELRQWLRKQAQS